MKICISAILLALLTISCSTTAKLRKAKKLIAEAEADGAKVSVDSVKKERLIKGDSGEFLFNLRDSVVYSYKDSLVRKDTTIYHYKTEKKTIWKHPTDTTANVNGISVNVKFKDGKLLIDAKCPDKKITETTAVNETINCPPQSDFWKWVALTVSAVLAFTIYLIVKKI